MSPTHNHNHQTGKRLGVAFLLNISFTIIELIGGYFTNSVAIVADALHDLGDSASLGIAWYLERISSKPGDEKFTFGYRRFSLLGAVTTGIILLVGSLIILKEAVPRMLEPEPVDPVGMFTLAILGVLVNGGAVLRMRAGHTLNERMVTLHLLEDVLGWLAVLIVSITVYFFDLPVLDPILSVLITLYVLRGVMINMKQALNLFLQGVPPEVNLEALVQSIRQIDGVTDVHHTHVWSQDGENHVMTTHIVLNPSFEKQRHDEIRHQVKQVASDMGISHATVEVEGGPGNCTDSMI